MSNEMTEEMTEEMQMTTVLSPLQLRFVTDIIGAARENISRSGYLTPVFLLSRTDRGSITPIMMDVDNKDASVTEVLRAVGVIKPDILIIISEAWAATRSMTSNRVDNSPAPSDDPARKEVVIISVEVTGHIWAGIAPMGPGNKSFGDIEWTGKVFDGTAEDGRFEWLLPTNRLTSAVSAFSNG